MAAPVAPTGDISLLQQMLGLVPQEDTSRQLQDVVFVCIDCEAYEFDHMKVTEVGVSILDTTKLDHVSFEGADNALLESFADVFRDQS